MIEPLAQVSSNIAQDVFHSKPDRLFAVCRLSRLGTTRFGTGSLTGTEDVYDWWWWTDWCHQINQSDQQRLIKINITLTVFVRLSLRKEVFTT